MAHSHPTTTDGITPAYLTGLIEELHPDSRVTDVEILDAKTYGEQMVSTAGRVSIGLCYAPGSDPALPKRMVLKLTRAVDKIMAPFYSNEVAFYRRLRPEFRDIEAPACYGGDFDPETTYFGLLLEDLTQRDATFPNVTKRITADRAKALLDVLARLHARYWNSPRFDTDLSWVETHLTGGVCDMMNNVAPHHIAHEIEHENFKRELVQRLRTNAAELLAGTQAVQRHQARLARTVLHGDTHLGNTYQLPDGRAGLLDWQLTVAGFHMHDVNYFITTALSIEDRRTHERELLAYYLDRLGAAGVAEPPSFEETWTEYRRALVWGVYIGWLTTPVVNYGWEINVLNHLRLTTAYEDHDTARLVAAVM